MTSSRTPRCFALIPAAGIGSRVGHVTPKQYLPIAGVPMILHTLRAFAHVAAIEKIVVVVAPDDDRFDIDLLDADLLDADLASRVLIARTGGATRDATVANGLDALCGTDGKTIADDDWVLVHDAARCGITAPLIDRLITRLRDDAVGGLLAIPLDDTVKREARDADPAAVAATVDRRGLWRAQTPQMFRHAMLRDALAMARSRGFAVTDEASAVEAAGHRVLLVPGATSNFKVTTADDLAMMDVLLRRA